MPAATTFRSRFPAGNLTFHTSRLQREPPNPNRLNWPEHRIPHTHRCNQHLPPAPLQRALARCQCYLCCRAQSTKCVPTCPPCIRLRWSALSYTASAALSCPALARTPGKAAVAHQSVDNGPDALGSPETTDRLRRESNNLYNPQSLGPNTTGP